MRTTKTKQSIQRIVQEIFSLTNLRISSISNLFYLRKKEKSKEKKSTFLSRIACFKQFSNNLFRTTIVDFQMIQFVKWNFR